MSLSKVKYFTLEYCSFQFNIGGSKASAIFISTPADLVILPEDTSLIHITITNCVFNNNGSISGNGAIKVSFA